MFDGSFTNTPHVPRKQAFLDSRAMVRNPVAVFEGYRKRLGPTFSFHFGGARRAIVSTEPAFIEQVLLRHRDKYHKSDIQVRRMVEFQGRGLVNIHGDEWLRQRRLVALGFKTSRLTQLVPLQVALLDELLEALDADAQRGAVDVHRHMVRITLGIVGRSIFGRTMDERELAQIGRAITEIQEFIVRQIVQPYLIPWFRLSGQSRHFQQIRRAADAVVLEHIARRCEEGVGEHDFLGLLLDTPYPESDEPMSKTQALVEALQLMVAGNETSSNGLTWILHLLGQHPEYVAAIRAEVEDVLGDHPVDFESLHRLETTTQVVQEALRLYPPFWMIDRVALVDDEICGVHIPKGCLVIPYIFGVHRNGDHWSNPDCFDPGRFSREARKSRDTYAYMPFGGGPRICVGNNMALMQMLLIISTLIRRYDIAATETRPVGIQPQMLLRPDGPVWMTFTPASEHVANQ